MYTYRVESQLPGHRLADFPNYCLDLSSPIKQSAISVTARTHGLPCMDDFSLIKFLVLHLFLILSRVLRVRDCYTGFGLDDWIY
jgi:hypothetical protein